MRSVERGHVCVRCFNLSGFMWVLVGVSVAHTWEWTWWDAKSSFVTYCEAHGLEIFPYAPVLIRSFKEAHINKAANWDQSCWSSNMALVDFVAWHCSTCFQYSKVGNSLQSLSHWLSSGIASLDFSIKAEQKQCYKWILLDSFARHPKLS